MAGASLKAVQEHLGHTTLTMTTMTQKYAHLSPEFQKAEVDRLNGVFLNHVPAKKEIDLENENIIAGNA
jgi:site-specific recombinase XerD